MSGFCNELVGGVGAAVVFTKCVCVHSVLLGKPGLVTDKYTAEFFVSGLCYSGYCKGTD